MSLILAVPAFAGQSEWGTIGCAWNQLGYVRFYYNDVADALPPGSSTWYLYRENDNNWHLHERNGNDGGGFWEVDADPYLNFNITAPGCRDYG
jgi:hypothetical protein